MRTRHHTLSTSALPALGLALTMALLAGCGGGGDVDATSARSPEASTLEVSIEDAETGDAPIATEAPMATEAPVAASTTVVEVNILTDFGDVCRGVKLPGATPYDPARPGIHPIETTAGESPEYGVGGVGLPTQWDPVIGEEHTVELVVCMDRTSTTLRDTCTGYLDDAGADTGNAVELYDATYTVRLVAAVTGEEIARTDLAATEDTCPSFFYFDAEGSVDQSFAEPTDAMTAWLAPFVET
ncbi:MAG: hypothetical protein NTZ21_03855 [Actinobacteria bacterium]|nr:hypothetical protein [Actinomycetota bacterium]